VSRITHLRNLITNHTRRLQKLREQAAISGRTTDPAILIQIEDIDLNFAQNS